MAICEQRRARFDIGPHKSFERFCRIVGDHRKAQSTGPRIDVFRASAPWPCPVGVALNHFDSAGDQELPGKLGSKNVSSTLWGFRPDPVRRRLRDARDAGQSWIVAISESATKLSC